MARVPYYGFGHHVRNDQRMYGNKTLPQKLSVERCSQEIQSNKFKSSHWKAGTQSLHPGVRIIGCLQQEDNTAPDLRQYDWRTRPSRPQHLSACSITSVQIPAGSYAILVALAIASSRSASRFLFTSSTALCFGVMTTWGSARCF